MFQNVAEFQSVSTSIVSWIKDILNFKVYQIQKSIQIQKCVKCKFKCGRPRNGPAERASFLVYNIWIKRKSTLDLKCSRLQKVSKLPDGTWVTYLLFWKESPNEVFVLNFIWAEKPCKWFYPIFFMHFFFILLCKASNVLTFHVAAVFHLIVNLNVTWSTFIQWTPSSSFLMYTNPCFLKGPVCWSVEIHVSGKCLPATEFIAALFTDFPT